MRGINVTSNPGAFEARKPIGDQCNCRELDHEVTAVIVAGVQRWGGDILDRFGCRLLLPVAGRPLIEHGVRWLTHAGLDDVCICANSDTQVIRESLDCVTESVSSLRYYEDAMPRGPAGCVRDAAIHSTADTIVVLEGSVIPSFDLHEMIETHRREAAAMTIAASSGPFRVGDCADRPAGVYILSNSAIREVKAKGYQDLKEVLVPRLYERGHRIAVHTVASGAALRVLDAASYLAANLTVIPRRVSAGLGCDGFVRNGDAWVHESATVHASARMMDAVIVGPDVRVGAMAMIVGPTFVGSGCTIGRHAVVSRSVLWDRCTVGPGIIIDHSLLTDGARAVNEDFVRNTVLC